MRIVVTGATGVIGSRLLPALVLRGHSVVGITRWQANAERLRSLGVAVLVLDVLDRAAVMQAVAAVRPDVIIHEATALTGVSDFRHFDRSFAETNRLRTEGTDNLIAAAEAAGTARIVAQSFACHRYERDGADAKTEDAPLDPSPPHAMQASVQAMEHLEQAVLGARGVVLRYGTFYGGSRDDALTEAVRHRRFPIVGNGDGIWSWVHVDDAAAATVLACQKEGPALYNVVDDDPAPVREWLPALAGALGADSPWRVPRWLGVLLAGEVPVMMATESRGASNLKAKNELGWQLRHPSWRTGFAASYRDTEREPLLWGARRPTAAPEETSVKGQRAGGAVSRR